jgi:hypothetical protein
MNRLVLLAYQIKSIPTLTITDTRNWKTYEIPVGNSFIKPSDLTKILHNSKFMQT